MLCFVVYVFIAGHCGTYSKGAVLTVAQTTTQKPSPSSLKPHVLHLMLSALQVWESKSVSCSVVSDSS